MRTTNKLNLDQSAIIAKAYFAASSIFTELDSEVRSKVGCSTTIEKDVAKCAFYIPGMRPELGKVLLVLSIDRNNGTVKEVGKNEF